MKESTTGWFKSCSILLPLLLVRRPEEKCFSTPHHAWPLCAFCLFESQFLCVYGTSVDNDLHTSCIIISACVKAPRVLETWNASQLWLSPFISHFFHSPFSFTYLTRQPEVKLIIIPWKECVVNGCVVCECFHVSIVIKPQMKGMSWEWETLLKFVLGCQIVFLPFPLPLFDSVDSLPPVIDRLLKYSSWLVTLPFWAPLWERSLSEYVNIWVQRGAPWIEDFTFTGCRS